jgi:hypothetical protein
VNPNSPDHPNPNPGSTITGNHPPPSTPVPPPSTATLHPPPPCSIPTRHPSRRPPPRNGFASTPLHRKALLPHLVASQAFVRRALLPMWCALRERLQLRPRATDLVAPPGGHGAPSQPVASSAAASGVMADACHAHQASLASPSRHAVGQDDGWQMVTHRKF